MTKTTIDFVRELYNTNEFIPLHAPVFGGNEKKYTLDAIESTFVSSVGQYVDLFERLVENYTGSVRAVATVNGTAALHAALHVIGLERGEVVITQPLTFVATCNVIYHMGAEPLFVDVSSKSLGLCPIALSSYLEDNAVIEDGVCRHKVTSQRIRAVLPMHTFGHPVELDELIEICKKWRLILVEDAAESLGSMYKGRHTGTFGQVSAVSFNGNKIITTGGGGAVLTSSDELGSKLKHQTTTAKTPHPYEYFHDEAGFNYRMPNINAALGCAQMEVLAGYIESKRYVAQKYQDFFEGSEYRFVIEPEYATSNYWLNAVVCEDQRHRDEFLKQTNDAGVMTRPAWCLMSTLPMYKDALKGSLENANYYAHRLVNIPSSPVAF